MVQIRNAPDTLHRKLEVRAADSGQTLSDYLLAYAWPRGPRATRPASTGERVTLKTPAAVVLREELESA